PHEVRDVAMAVPNNTTHRWCSGYGTRCQEMNVNIESRTMENSTMRQFVTALLFFVMVWLGGCSDMSPTAQRTLSGGAIGAGGGAIIGAIAGNAGMGAAIGGAAGLAGGYVYDYHKRSQQQAYEQGYQAGSSR